jgi:hypothetical protein
MRQERAGSTDPRIAAALVDLQNRIKARYPAATFSTFHGEDPDGMYLRTTVDIEDPEEALDTVIDRLVELGDEEVPVYVIAVQPLERVDRSLRSQLRPPRAPVVSRLLRS